MILESTDKPLWLVKDIYTPVGLPDDKKILLDFGGRYNFALAKLVDHINEWKVRPRSGNRGVNAKQVPTLSWPNVEKLIRQTSQDEAVLFDLVENHQQAAVAIEKGWSISTELSEEDNLNNFVIDEDDSEDGDYNHNRRKRKVLHDTKDEQESDASLLPVQPSRRTRRSRSFRWA